MRPFKTTSTLRKWWRNIKIKNKNEKLTKKKVKKYNSQGMK